MNIVKRAMLRLRPVRRGQSKSDWRSARDWWKAPVLQGLFEFRPSPADIRTEKRSRRRVTNEAGPGSEPVCL